MATGLHAMLTRHPWLVQAMGSHVWYGPNNARYDDRILAICEAAGFTGAQADQTAGALFTFVLGNTVGPAAAAALTRKLGRDGGNADELMRDGIAKAHEIAMRFPTLRARLGTTAATDYGAAPEDAFGFGLRALLDGLEAQLGR